MDIQGGVLTEERARKAYTDRLMSIAEIAEEYDTTLHKVRSLIDRAGVNTRGNGGSRRERNLEKPAGFYTCTTRGYEFAFGVSRKNEEYEKEVVPIHRLVAVAEYGFEAVANNDVHHINGVGWDNRPTNIDVMTQEEHMRQHWHERSIMTAMKKANRKEIYHALEATGHLDLLNGGLE